MNDLNWWYVLAPFAVVSLVGIGMSIGTVNSDSKQFRELMNEIRKDLSEIFVRLGPKVTASSSPNRLPELGKASMRGKAEEFGKDLQYESKSKQAITR